MFEFGMIAELLTDNGFILVGSGGGVCIPAHITIPGLPGGSVATVTCSLPPATNTATTPTITATTGGLLAEALLGYPLYAKTTAAAATTSADTAGRVKESSTDDLPLGATFETPGVGSLGSLSPSSNNEEPVNNIELDNAGRVKSGKVTF